VYKALFILLHARRAELLISQLVEEPTECFSRSHRSLFLGAPRKLETAQGYPVVINSSLKLAEMISMIVKMVFCVGLQGISIE
jgi:hypothetical protein